MAWPRLGVPVPSCSRAGDPPLAARRAGSRARRHQGRSPSLRHGWGRRGGREAVGAAPGRARSGGEGRAAGAVGFRGPAGAVEVQNPGRGARVPAERPRLSRRSLLSAAGKGRFSKAGRIWRRRGGVLLVAAVWRCVLCSRRGCGCGCLVSGFFIGRCASSFLGVLGCVGCWVHSLKAYRVPRSGALVSELLGLSPPSSFFFGEIFLL